MKKYWFIWMAFLVASFASTAQEVAVVIDHEEIKIGEQTTINIELQFPAAKRSIIMPALQDTITKFIEIIEISDIDTTFDEDDITTKIFTQKITITSWDSGYHAIPPFVFIIDGDTIKSNPLLLTVNSIPVKAEEDIKDIKDIIDVPFSLWDWILKHRLVIGVALIVLLLLIIGLIWYKKYASKPKEEKLIVVPKEAADIVANRKLQELEKRELWQKNKMKEYYSELSFITREYIENRFNINALEQTTQEIIEALSIAKLAIKEKEQLLELLALADMAKFAKQQPIASENQRSLKIAYSFVEQTKIIPDSTMDSMEKTDVSKNDEHA